MKKLFTVLYIMAFVPLFAQVAGQDFTSKEFGWTIKIPNGYESVSPKDWEKMQANGADLIGDAIDEDITEAIEINKTIFVIRSGQFNFLEVSQQPFDPAVDGSYAESNAMVIEALKETFTKQMPMAKTSNVVSKEIIGGVEFTKNEMKVTMPNGGAFYCYMYSRLFGKKDFCVNIMYIDKVQGKIMMEAFKSSTFK